MGRVIAIVNQKGGVGKTTTAVNLGASLAEGGCRVLLVDFDPQGNASSGVGLAKGEAVHSIYDALIGDVPLSQVIRPTALPNLFLVPATRDLAGAEIELVSEPGREGRLRALLDQVRDDYDYILIDCPPSLSLLTVNALTATQGIVVPMQCEYYALEGLSELLSTIESIRQSMNPTLAVDGVLLCMHDPRTNLTHQVEQEVRQHLGDKVFQTVIPRNIRLSEAPSHGQPILLYDRDSRGCQSYLSLASEFLRNRSRDSIPRPTTTNEAAA